MQQRWGLGKGVVMDISSCFKTHLIQESLQHRCCLHGQRTRNTDRLLQNYWKNWKEVHHKTKQITPGRRTCIEKMNRALHLSLDQGRGVTKAFSSVTLFSQLLRIIKTLITSWISHSYLAGITTAEQWHISNIQNPDDSFTKSEISPT